MRFWQQFTRRGQALVIAGLVVVLVSWVVRQRDVVWIGVAMVALPLAALAWINQPLPMLRSNRRIQPSQVQVGQTARVQLEVSNLQRGPLALLLFEEALNPGLGRRPRFSLPAEPGDWRHTFDYTIAARRRGHYQVGPLLVRNADPFGLANRDRHFERTSKLTVTPQVFRLTAPNGGGPGMSADASTAHATLVGQDDVLVREYRHGDDVRRVHWRSTAKTGSLMVRREEQSWDPQARIVLDNRRGAHAGDDVTGSFEWAVSAAASIATSLCDQGYRVIVSTAHGPLVDARNSSDRLEVAAHILRAMTDVELVDEPSLAAAGASHQENATEQLLVVVLGRLVKADLADLAALHIGPSQAVAIMLDVPTFAGSSHDENAGYHARQLANLGWASAVANSGTTVEQAWLDAQSSVAVKR